MDTLSHKLTEAELGHSMSALPYRSADELRQDISAHRTALAETINELDERFQQAVDWRMHVGSHPYVTLGIAAGVGILVANIFRPKPTPQERMLEAMAESVEHICGESSRRFDSLLSRVPPTRSTGWQGLLLGLATQAVTSYLKGKVERSTAPINNQIN